MGIIAMRKVAVVSIDTFGTVMGVVDLQAFVALGIVFLSIVVHLVGQPFNTEKPNGKRLHKLEFVALAICWFTFWGGLLYFLGNDKPGSVNSSVLIVTTVLLVLTNCTFLIYSIFIFGREYLRDRRIAQKREKDKKLAAETNTESINNDEQNPTQIVPIDNASTSTSTDASAEENATATSTAATATSSFIQPIDDDMDHDQHIDNVINEHHGHEERLNELHRERSQRAKRKTQLRLLERSKIKSLRILAQVPGFSQMNEIKISKMVDNMKLIKYRPNDIICQEGDAANSFYVILEGNCRLLHRDMVVDEWLR